MQGGGVALSDALRAAGRNNQDIRMAGDFMAGDQRTLEARLLAAQDQGKDWGTLGDALSLAAMVTSAGSLAAPAASANASGAAMSAGGTASTVPTVGSGWANILKGPKMPMPKGIT